MTKRANMIGLVAPRPGSGKDTFFEVLREVSPQGALLDNIKFATALEQEVYDCFISTPLWDLQWIRNDAVAKDHPFGFLALNKINTQWNADAIGYRAWAESKEYDLDEPRSMRWHLIQYGTLYKRQHLGHDDYWLKKGMAKARSSYESGRIPVVTDVRFPNEALRIKRVGGTLVYIQPDWTPKESGGVADGLISPEDCSIIVNNLKVNKTNMVKEFLNEYTI